MNEQSHAVILGITADIGREIALRLLRDGWRVSGFGRDASRVSDLSTMQGFEFYSCDLGDPDSIRAATDMVSANWKLFVSCAGTMEPIGPFFEQDFDAWETSVRVNSTAQLRFLHGVWSQRGLQPHVMLLAGGGTNNPFTNYSAYTVSKIALIKMCELIDDEDPDVNAFIIGPGYMRTRIHDETLNAGNAAGQALQNTRAFLEQGEIGTSHDDLYHHMLWCMEQGRSVTGGRNFSTVHDAWRSGGQALAETLKHSTDSYRLRRAKPEN